MSKTIDLTDRTVADVAEWRRRPTTYLMGATASEGLIVFCDPAVNAAVQAWGAVAPLILRDSGTRI